jgi:iron-sulfur cluster repair protein YtfE (RIC family)
MPGVTQPLRDEHQDLLPHIEEIRTVADAVGDVPVEALRQRVDQVYEFLAHHLIAHAEAEDKALYPVVAKVMGAPEATATMRRDHVEIGRLVKELASLRAQLSGAAPDQMLIKGLRRVMYGLYALVKVHFMKEEEVFLPLLDARLTPADAHRMFEDMEAAAREAKARLNA